MTPLEFNEQFPEFRTAGSLVAFALAKATKRVAANIFGSKTEDAIGFLTAHLLAISPYGRSLRLVSDDGETIYWKEFTALRREVSPRMIVV